VYELEAVPDTQTGLIFVKSVAHRSQCVAMWALVRYNIVDEEMCLP